MGCASSKKIEAATLDVYRPAPTSFAVFDINSIEEPWLKLEAPQHDERKSSRVPAPILEKLSNFEQQPSDAPRTWNEISKALEDLAKSTAEEDKSPPTEPPESIADRKKPRKSISFHTVEEIDAKLNPISPIPNSKRSQFRKTESMRSERSIVAGEFKPVKENVFLLRDRMEREKEGKAAVFDKIRRDPLSQFPEKCPPGGANAVVLYTTSLRGVRRTSEDCNTVRAVLENHRVVFDERDVSLHGEFLSELRGVVGGEEEGGGGGMVVPVPRLFVKGRYLGGVEEVVELNESGRLGRILRWAGVERGVGMQACEGCGGARFVPCLGCGGSCRVVVGDKGEKERCSKCNENGLIQCPLCH